MRPSFVRNSWFLLVALLLVSCSQKPEQVDNLRGGKVEIAAHGGMGFTNLINPTNMLPSNSMGGIRKALDLGVEGLEVDVQMTADSVLILYHDRELGSRTKVEGCLQDHLAKDVIGQPYQCGFPYDLFQDEVVITLDSLITYLKQRDRFPVLYLDIRSFNTCSTDGFAMAEVLGRQIGGLLQKHDLTREQLIPIATVTDLLKQIRALEPRYYLVFEETGDMDLGLERVIKHNFDAVAVKPKLLTPEWSARFHKAGKEVITFGGKTRSGIIDLLKCNPDVIQADNVSAFVDLMRE